MQSAQETIGAIQGLTENEAAARLRRDGHNELPASRRHGILHIIFGVIKEPMFILLVACGGLYLVLGDLAEAVMLLGFVFVIIGITVYQEGKTERAIEALRDLSSPRALVIRGGVQKRIAGRDVVVGDIIVLKEGDRVPADATLVWGLTMTADESILTGESVAVRKLPAADVPTERIPRRPGGDDLPFLYSGSLIVHGQGVAEVMATGVHTEMGKIGKSLGAIKEEETFLQRETGRLVKKIFVVAALLCVVVTVAYGLTRGDWLHGVLSGVTLAMAMLPEEFPVVLTIFLALGAWRLCRKQVLTRKIAAVEILGSATVLCVDKTGTLTQNTMSISRLFNGTAFYDVAANPARGAFPEAFHELIEYGILASKQDPFDPMEKALRELGAVTLNNTEHMHPQWPLAEEYPLSRELMALSHAWRPFEGTGYVIAAKGAPEAIADLCHISAAEKEALSRHVYAMAGAGLRVLGVAKATFHKERLPQSQHDFDFKFVGLIGLADPIRPTVPSAIQECYRAGIRVVMITGDYPVTAQNIARQIGLANPERVITGPELAAMDAVELRERIHQTNIFSRVVPEQKLLIVGALKSAGEVVAMTGDGVNDAPALKAAHIGVAMGERGTDVARESSDLVLLDDDFSSIVAAVASGRRIFDNLKKAMAYIISVHIPIAGASLIPVLLQWPLILYPAHIVFLELIIDPACSVVFESEPAERGSMQRPPRSPSEPLFSKPLLQMSFLQGILSLVAVMVVFVLALQWGQSEGSARTLAFATLLISNICLILTNRSWSRSIIASFSVANRSLVWVVAGAIVFLVAAMYVPVLQQLFHFERIHLPDIAICLSAGIISVVWFEAVKYVRGRTPRSSRGGSLPPS